MYVKAVNCYISLYFFKNVYIYSQTRCNTVQPVRGVCLVCTNCSVIHPDTNTCVFFHSSQAEII